MERERYPIGIENFEALISGGYVYVDKTEFIHRLVSTSKYYLLCRPRRFGKSLLLSSLECFFSGKRHLFEGLAIYRYDYDWEPRPVFHLNFVNLDTSSPENLISFLSNQFDEWDSLYGISTSGRQLSQRWQAIIEKAYASSGKRVVVLIDEYDKPLVSNLGDEGINDRFREILKPVYANLKRCDGAIEFAMLTGVSRFTRLSIFSDINNLRDISMLDEYSAICGITESELHDFCRPGIERMASALGKSYEEVLAVLKENYDGYHFSEKSEDIYNPYSLLTTLENCRIGAYWYETGTPSFLMRQLQKLTTPLSDLINDEASESELCSADLLTRRPVSLLYQTGYLTIKGYDDELETYRLGLPNKEVTKGFFEGLLPFYMDMRKDDALDGIRSLYKSLRDGEAEEFVRRLQSLLSGIPYNLSGASHEIYFENNLFIIFKLIGLYVASEYTTSCGRIDIVMSTSKYVYVVELKLDGSASDAMRQIDAKGYALPFKYSGKKIIKIGINFSSKTRNISEWTIG